ncbi:MAG: hydroxymethylpyrimidine/phosphomethylpyrimidine kinase [Bacteroidia bacterium]
MAKDKRPIILCIAGFDPSGGAGILADIKTTESIGVYGIGVVTSMTVQTENVFEKLQWRNISDIIYEIQFLIQHYPVQYAKIGIVQNLQMLKKIVQLLYQHQVKIIWDPILKSSTNQVFFDRKNLSKVYDIINKIYCITPNANEVLELTSYNNVEIAGQHLSQYCNLIIKGGHRSTKKGIDSLYLKNKNKPIEFFPNKKLKIFSKHGSGCVFSTALTSYLAKNYSLTQATQLAKQYTEKFLASNKTLLGYHS